MSNVTTATFTFEHNPDFYHADFAAKAAEAGVYFEYEQTITFRGKQNPDGETFDETHSCFQTIKIVACPENLYFINDFKSVVPKPCEVVIEDELFEDTTVEVLEAA